MTMTSPLDHVPTRNRPSDPAQSPGSGPRAPESVARRSSCAIAGALDIVGDRWTLLIVRDLIGGKRRYTDFLRSSERIPTNILANRLRLLERSGVIERVPVRELSRRRAYRLTPAGQALGQVVDALATWGLQHLPGTTRSIWPSPVDRSQEGPGIRMAASGRASGSPLLGRTPRTE
jgi:DNA-binding HxlR family transcriptional regulator